MNGNNRAKTLSADILVLQFSTDLVISSNRKWEIQNFSSFSIICTLPKILTMVAESEQNV